MIRTLKLHNFKCFENISFDLSPLNILSGVNGMGKSTVIQSLLLLRQSHMQKTLEHEGLSLNGDLISIGTPRDALCQWRKEDE